MCYEEIVRTVSFQHSTESSDLSPLHCLYWSLFQFLHTMEADRKSLITQQSITLRSQPNCVLLQVSLTPMSAQQWLTVGEGRLHSRHPTLRWSVSPITGQLETKCGSAKSKETEVMGIERKERSSYERAEQTDKQIREKGKFNFKFENHPSRN